MNNDQYKDILVCDILSSAVVECLTRDRGVAGLSVTVGHCDVSLSKTLYPLLSTGSTKEDPSGHDSKNIHRAVKNQIKACDVIPHVQSPAINPRFTFTVNGWINTCLK